MNKGAAVFTVLAALWFVLNVAQVVLGVGGSEEDATRWLKWFEAPKVQLGVSASFVFAGAGLVYFTQSKYLKQRAALKRANSLNAEKDDKIAQLQHELERRFASPDETARRIAEALGFIDEDARALEEDQREGREVDKSNVDRCIENLRQVLRDGFVTPKPTRELEESLETAKSNREPHYLLPPRIRRVCTYFTAHLNERRAVSELNPSFMWSDDRATR